MVDNFWCPFTFRAIDVWEPESGCPLSVNIAIELEPHCLLEVIALVSIQSLSFNLFCFDVTFDVALADDVVDQGFHITVLWCVAVHVWLKTHHVHTPTGAVLCSQKHSHRARLSGPVISQINRDDTVEHDNPICLPK